MHMCWCENIHVYMYVYNCLHTQMLMSVLPVPITVNSCVSTLMGRTTVTAGRTML